MKIENLEVAQALFVVKRLPGEILPQLATRLLESGADTPSVRELAGMTRPTLRDSEVVFRRVLLELGRPEMEVEKAAMVVARELARMVCSGEATPQEAAQRGSFYSSDYQDPDCLTTFLALADDYECFPKRHSEIDADIRKYCEELLSKHP